MTREEISKAFHIDSDMLDEFDSYLDKHDDQYSDEDIDLLSDMLTLQKIGLSSKDIASYLECIRQGDISKKKRVDMLRKHREGVMNELHGCQNSIDCIDYLIYELRDTK